MPIFQALLCFNDPESHPCISQKELDYLKTELGRLKRAENLPATPWKDIIGSPPMLAIIIAQVN